MALIASDIPGIDRDKLGFAFFFFQMIYIYIYMCVCVCMYVCIYVCMYVLTIVVWENFRCMKMAIVHDIAEGEKIIYVLYLMWK